MSDTATQTLPDRDAHGILLVFLAGVLWSTVGLGIRLIDEAVVWQILFYRSFSLSLLLYVVIRLRTGKDPFVLARQAGLRGILGGLSLVAAYGGGIFALQSTSVANAMLLFASAPFMAAILGLVVLREGVRLHTWAAIGLACVGIGVMVWNQTGNASMMGNLAALGSAFSFAVFTIIIRWGKSGEMLPLVFVSGILGVFIMGAICLLLGLPLILTPQDGGIALSMGIFQVGAGLILYTIGSKSVPAAELTLLSMAEVVLGPVWVWLFLGETTTQQTLFGGAILLAAIAGNAFVGTRRRPPVPRA